MSGDLDEDAIKDCLDADKYDEIPNAMVSDIELSPSSNHDEEPCVTLPLQSTPYDSNVANKHLKHDILPALTPIRPMLNNRQFDVSNNQSVNNTVATIDTNQSFDANLYNQLIIDARLLYKSGNNLEKALNKYEEAYNLHGDMKLYKRIVKIRTQLKFKDIDDDFNEPAKEDHILEMYNNLVIDAKSHIEAGKYNEAVNLYEEAYKVDPSDKLLQKISKLKSDFMFNNDKSEPEVDVHLYNNLIKMAKTELNEENYQPGLILYKQANEINPSEKLLKRINKIETFLKGHFDENFQTVHSIENEKNESAEAQSLHQSENESDINEYFSEILQKGKNCEEKCEIEQAIDYYRECQKIKPSPFLYTKIKELEEKCDINNDDNQETELDVEDYNKLIARGREYLNNGNLKQALVTYEQALAMNHSDKLMKRIEKIKLKISEATVNSDDENKSVDDEIKLFYDATVAQAREKEELLLYDEAIALFEEANELIPKETITQKITRLEFKRDSVVDQHEVRKDDKIKSLDEVSAKERMKYNELISKGKIAQKESKIENSISYYKKALKIYKNEKLVVRMNKLQKVLDEEEEQENWYSDLGDGFFLTNEVFEKLYDYQREGVKWMWTLYRAKHGGILGDDMGLGKTIQTIVYLQAMFVMEEISSVMLVMPLSLVDNWQAEFEKWAPEIRVEIFHGSKSERERNVKRVMKKGGVALTTYGIIEKNVEFLVNTSFKWDYLILDEGHKIKNPTKTSKAMRNVPCNHRLLISGTPIQNNLKELWALFDFVSRGKLLGTMTTFKMNYSTPIERARQKDASKAEARLGTKLAENLRKLINPFFLRRTKAEIKKKNTGSCAGINNLGKKNELCVWLKLSEGQHNLYKAFLTLDTVRHAMNLSKSPLAALTVLKKICDHPRLAIKFEALREVMDSDAMDMNVEDHKKLLSTVKLPENPSVDMLQKESCKLKFTVQLLEMLHSTGHRTLLFSTSLKILDYVQSMIAEEGIRCLRIDGSINKPGARQAIIDKFNADEQFTVFLLTTQVGGVGLNLTSADRVIIYDPNWNPATDSQAVDRAYRIGQTKPVIVYRILTSGTIEEKIYRKQVFKNSITRQATGDSIDPIRYFTNQEISQLFLLGNTSYSETCQQLEELHGAARNHSEQMKTDVLELTRMGAIGCSDHDLLFSHEEEVDNTPEERKYVDEMVEKAKQNLALDNGAAQRPGPHFHAPGGHGFDARTTAVPLGGGQRGAQEPTRGHSIWNKKETDIEAVRKDIAEIELRESPYFKTAESSNESSNASSSGIQIIDAPPSAPIEVIDVIDDERDDKVIEEKRKLSLSDYKKKQLKIYDFIKSPVQQPHHSIRPSSVSPERQPRIIKRNVVTPRKSMCDPVGLIINNHMQLNSPKKRHDSSDEEVENDLENSKYDNLNKPPCLADSDEDEDDAEDEEIDLKGHLGEKVGLEEVQLVDDSDDDKSDEKEEKVEALTTLIDTFKFNSPNASPQLDDSKNKVLVTSNAANLPKSLIVGEENAVNEKNDKNMKSPASSGQAADLKDTPLLAPSDTSASFKQLSKTPSKTDIVEKTPDPDLQQFSKPEEDKENETVNSKPTKSSTSTGACSCGRSQLAKDKGYNVTKCLCMCTPSDQDKYNKYLQRGLEHHKSGTTEKAIRYYKAALQYRNDDMHVQKAYLNLKRALKS